MNLRRSFENLFRGQAVLLTTRSKTNPAEAVPVTSDDPLPVTVVGGGSSGGGEGGSIPAVTATLPSQALTVTASPTPLTPPGGATHATVHVVTGAVRRSIGGTPGAATPLLSAGDSEAISGAELAAYRLVREGASDAQLLIEYRVVG